LAGGLQPDLLDPQASFYVEAKQYASSSAHADIVRSVAQVLDTVGRLRGGPYAVHEAFCVVFRRDGPYYDLPSVLPTETYRLHLVVVDVAPSDRSRSDAPKQTRSDSCRRVLRDSALRHAIHVTIGPAHPRVAEVIAQARLTETRLSEAERLVPPPRPGFSRRPVVAARRIANSPDCRHG
jgi:hypothetical protein